MLHASNEETDFVDIPLNGEDPTDSNSPQADRAIRSILTYEMFLRQYWPHFSQTLTKGLGTLRFTTLCLSNLLRVLQILPLFSASLWVSLKAPRTP